MDRRAQGALLLALGGVSVRLVVTGTALNFIQPTYVPILGVAGAALIILGGVTLWQAIRPGTHVTDDDDTPHAEATVDHDLDHDHEHGPRIAWMLAAPLFAIMLIAPQPLGSFAATRQAGVAIEDPGTQFPPLPDPVDGAVDLTLQDFTARALYDPDASLDGVRVRLTGFASTVGSDSWTLTRFAIACCAADGMAINVEIAGGPPPPGIDQWVVVEGEWTPPAGHEPGQLTTDPPLLAIDTLRATTQPDEPYEV